MGATESTGEERGGGTAWKKVKGLAKQAYMHHPQADNSVGMARGIGEGAREGRWAKGGKNGDICNSVNNKNKKESTRYDILT